MLFLALHHACWNGSQEMAVFLVESGINVHKEDIDHWTVKKKKNFPI
jgi:hypothetical protein